MSEDLAQIRAEAVRALSHVEYWELTPARWELLAGMLDALAAAPADDVDAIAVATADLELAGPMRITPIGAGNTRPEAGLTGVVRIPVPPKIRERVNELIHMLRGGGDPGRAR
ncbi:hypothetical protein Caci_6578 [Catenulispora acidiphila DSM 44928]|uniref:CATRA-Associated Small Protein domain-containing protein n=1 Tax=Catenulispora acidiphila (strain DSM 44928 / JCM 14897 / NBRC 102108 / NRRL B-24433 / ID139908) TaxID=479433 RepID=C7PYD4_CATAD|nr:CATRA system-associated protein [Catenulispora acidiphila]ACU75424.1 hypothetical protein Caci_6578 [Catenulispora acidiphila DSM 44928]